jgi:hypothetical protein
MLNIVTGQLYYTASSAVGAGSVDITQFVLNSQTGSFSITGSNTFIGNQTISGSLITTGSVNFTNLTTESQQWVVTYNSASGQLYYTASSAIGGGTTNIDTSKFITTGSSGLTQAITGSLVISDYLKLGTAPFPTWASNTGSRFDSINYYNNPTTSSWTTDTMARWVRSFYGSSSVTNLSTYRNQAVAFSNHVELAPGQTYNIAATNWDFRKTGMTSQLGIGVSGSNGVLTTYNSGYTLNSTNYGMVSILDTWPEFDTGTNRKRYNGQYAIYGGTYDIYAASGSSAEKFMFYTAGGLKNFISTSIDNLTNYYSTLETQSFSTSRINNVYGFYSAPLYRSYATQSYGFYQSGSNDINYFEGKVGIGTQTPTGSLHVSGTVYFPNLTDSTSNVTSKIVLIDSNGKLVVTTPFALLGTSPATQSILSFTDNGTFTTDRWNTETDSYTISASWTNGQYNFTGANIRTGSIVLASTSTPNATQLSYNIPSSPLSIYSSGSETFTLYVTASNPLDNSIYAVSQSIQLTLAKSTPSGLILSTEATVQLGEDFRQIEQGATGSISFTAQTGSNANRWKIQSFSGSGEHSTNRVPLFSNSNGAGTTTTFFVTGSSTGSATIRLEATASYNSNGLASPEEVHVEKSSILYTKIISVRGGASASSSFTESELLNIGKWNIASGGSVGTIYKGQENPNGFTVTINWVDDKYLYIIYDSSQSDLSAILSGALPSNAFGNPINSPTIVGPYKVYRTILEQAGTTAGKTITYTLQT